MGDYKVKGIPPDMTEAAFLAVLRNGNSPVMETPMSARAVYSYCLARGLSPAFLLALFNHESSFGTRGTATESHSWGNTREPSFGIPSIGVVAGRVGSFSRYQTWIDGGISTVARFFDHKPYANAFTVREIIPIWAPSSENDTERYIAAVLADIARYTFSDAPGAQKGTTMPPKPPMTQRPSPNRNGYAGTRRVDAILWHITAGTDSLPWLTSPASKASSNYLIARNGTIYELVPPNQDAWANGAVNKPNTANPLIAKWQAEGVNFNQRTISIEHEGFSSKGKGGSLTSAQVASTVALTAWLCAQNNLTPDRAHIFGHNQIDSVNRPDCPGFSEAEWNLWVSQVKGLAAPLPQPASPPFQHAPGFIGPPIRDSFDWGGDSAGVITKRVLEVYNDETRQNYRLTWTPAEGVKVEAI